MPISEQKPKGVYKQKNSRPVSEKFVLDYESRLEAKGFLASCGTIQPLSVDALQLDGWLAGVLDGEGCFEYQCSPGIALGNTDKDLVDKVAFLFGKGEARGPYKYKRNKKPVFYTEVWGSKAIAWMMLLYPFLSARRQQRIREILERWSNTPTRGFDPMPRKSRCHPALPLYARGMCKNCYKKWRRANGLS